MGRVVLTAEQVRDYAEAFRTFHVKRGGNPYGLFKLWAASKALTKVEKRQVWDAVCEVRHDQ